MTTPRLPPSARDTDSVEQRIIRQLQSMSPGTVGGRLASAGPITGAGGGGSAIEPAMGAGSDDGTGAVVFAYDTFTLASATPTLTLTYLPESTESVHVYLNGLTQLENTDYVLSGKSLAVQAAMDAESGDVIDVRYAYLLDMPDEPEDETGEVGPTDRSDDLVGVGDTLTPAEGIGGCGGWSADVFLRASRAALQATWDGTTLEAWRTSSDGIAITAHLICQDDTTGCLSSYASVNAASPAVDFHVVLDNAVPAGSTVVGAMIRHAVSGTHYCTRAWGLIFDEVNP